MNRFKNRIKRNEFLIKIVSVSIVGIILSALITLYLFVLITEKNILKTYEETQHRILEDIAHSYNESYSTLINLQNSLNDNTQIYQYLNDLERDSQKSRELSYQVTQFFKNHQQDLNFLNANLLLLTEDNSYYALGDQRIMSPSHLKQSDLLNLDHPNFTIKLSDAGLTNLTQSNSQIIIVSPLVYKGNMYGKAVLSINQKHFDNIYDRFLDDKSTFVFVDNFDNIIYPNIENHPDVESYLTYKNTIMSEAKLEIPHLKIVSFLDRSALINDVYRLRTVFISILFVSAVLAFILFRIVKTITQPIYLLSEELNKYPDKPKHLDIHGAYEIQTLVQAYNSMLDDLDLYIADILNLEKQKLDSDLIALQRQINPHFMYNTLTSIRFLILSNNNTQAEEAILDFIVLLKSLSNFDSQSVKLEDEMNVLEHYINIQRLRFGPNIDVNIDLPHDLKAYHIPKLILQPFIENALFHAFEHKQGFVNVAINKVDEHLIIEVMDNGSGMSKQTLDTIHEQMNLDSPTQHIGITNVHQRIQILYGQDYGVNIHSDEGFGTIVRITLPLI